MNSISHWLSIDKVRCSDCINLHCCQNSDAQHGQPRPVLWSHSHLVAVAAQSLSHVRLFVTPWTAACHASLSFTIFLSLPKLMSIESLMPSNQVSFVVSNATLARLNFVSIYGMLPEKAMAPHSSTLAWKNPKWTEEPGRLQSTGSLRVKHN